MTKTWTLLLIVGLAGGCAAAPDGATNEGDPSAVGADEAPAAPEEVAKVAQAAQRKASCYVSFFQTCRTNAIQAGTNNTLYVEQGPFSIVDVYDTQSGARVYHHEAGWLSHSGSVGGLYGWYYARAKSTDAITLTKVVITSYR